MSTKAVEPNPDPLWTPPGDVASAESSQTLLIEQYKLYVEMADRIAERRHSTNNFFLTINTALVGILGFIDKFPGADTHGDKLLWAIAVAGIPLNVLWFQIIDSYKKIAAIKWELVAEIEQHLVVRPYRLEWERAGKGKDAVRYRPFTHIEIAIPWLFVVLHSAILAQAIPWAVLFAKLGRVTADL